MANWKETLNISDLHEAYEAGGLSVKDLSDKVHYRCMNLKCANDPAFQDIILSFIDIDDIDDYDDVLGDLYNYGDIDNRLWIQTFFELKH